MAQFVTAIAPESGRWERVGEEGAPSVTTVIEAILNQAVVGPDRVALRSHATVLTYGHLERAAAQVAELLVQRGVQPGDHIGACFSERVQQIIAMVAVWRLGAVFVPLDPTHPVALIDYEIKEAQLKLLVCDSAARELLVSLNAECIDIGEGMADSSSPAPMRRLQVEPSDPALILFTSGTTGQPKGVRILHQNVAHLVDSACAAYQFSSADAFCTIARPTFSISLFEVCCPLAVGAMLHVVRRDDIFQMDFLATLLGEVTVLHAGPSLLSRLFRHVARADIKEKQFGRVRHVSTGGDIVLPTVMEGLKNVFPNAELFVIYGCTETCCMSTAYAIPRGKKVEKTLVGRPFPRVGLKLLTEGGALAAVDEAGEICFSGPGVVPGYLNRPEVERERFFMLDGVRYYRTGDLGRWDEQGNLEFLGRNDFQVQVRGMRVELVGIENTTRELKLADDCAATLHSHAEGDERLVLFVQNPTKEPLQIRHALAERFADFMVPQHVVPIPALPLTPNGKLDRRALRQLSIENSSESSDADFASSAEVRVANVLRKVLRAARVRPSDNFFDLGGHSLLALEAAEAIKDETGLPATAALILRAPTVRGLVQLLTEGQDRALRPIRLNAGTADKKLFLFMGVHSYSELARQLSDRFAVFGVFIEHEITYLLPGAHPLSVPELATQYVTLMKREQPEGPYRIGGHSFGGIIAFEAAQQLRRRGEVVEQLVLLDAMVPEFGWVGFTQKLRRFVLQPQVQRAWVKQRMSRMLGRVRGQHQAQFGRFFDAKFGDMEIKRMDAYTRVHAQYLPLMERSPIPTTLVIAGKRLMEAPLAARDGGWSSYLACARSVVIDARHLEILQVPWAEEIARIIAAR